jgi:alpha-methylacyl-CoA racemase
VLQALMLQRRGGRGVRFEVALSQAAQWLALPRQWDMMGPESPLGGGHAGYRVYPCKNGRVALAALEPHFSAALLAAVGLPANDPGAMARPETREAVAAFLATRTRRQLEKLARERDIPLHTLD